MEATILDETLQEMLRVAPGQLIAARIKRARKLKGWSHDQLGVAMNGVSRQHLIKLEKGKHRPRLEMLLRIAEATGREPEWFVNPDVDGAPFPVQDDEEA
jgi:transcriptional regulator with XRE-family HTH domain